MFENKVLRWTFGSKEEEEVMEGWRQLSSEELHDLYVFLTKYYWDDHIMKEKMVEYKHAWRRQQMHKNVWKNNLKERGCSEDMAVDRKKIVI